MEEEAKQELRKKKLSDIEPITHSHIRVTSKAELAQVVEGPLLSACEDLYDKNIQTYMSSANKGVLVGEHSTADFSIKYDALSEKNKEIAQQLAAEKLAGLIPGVDVFPARLNVDIPVNAESTWGDIEDAATKIANRFVAQRFMPEAYTPEFLIQHLAYAINEDIKDGDSVTPEYIERHGYVFDSQSGMFFLNKEDIERAYQPVKGEDPNEPLQFSKVYEPKVETEEQWITRIQAEFQEAVKELESLEAKKSNGEDVDAEVSHIRDFIEAAGEQINDYEFRRGKKLEE